MSFTGKVIHGSKHGRSIGYPTINLENTDSIKQALSKYGVYAVSVMIGKEEYCGALFWGMRSLFVETEPVCEISLLDFEGDAYGEVITIEVIQYIRPALAITKKEELQKLIKKDIRDVKKAYDISRS